MDTYGIGVVAILLFLGVFAVFSVAATADHHSSVQKNQDVPAEVVSVEVDQRMNDDEIEYTPVVVYRYTVDGESYTSDNVHPGGFVRWYGSRSTAESMVDRYEEGSDVRRDGEPVVAYYNPSAPDEAYLYDPGWPGGWWIAVVYSLLAVVGGGYLAREGFVLWRQRQMIKNTPTENARSLSIGPSELRGTAIPADGAGFAAPFSEDECVVADYEVEQYDDSGDNSTWRTKEEDVLHIPFYVEDDTGRVLVRPHDDAVYDLDPDTWTETYVDSSDKGPEPVQRFLSNSTLSYPSDSSGKDNDRKYRQNLVEAGDEVYVFGTVRPRDTEYIPDEPTSADRLVVEKVTDNSMREPMYLISDDSPTDLVGRRKWALWRLPAGGFFVLSAIAVSVYVFGPVLGLDIPRTFDGWIDNVS